MKTKLQHPVPLKDALYNCSTEITTNSSSDFIERLNKSQVYGLGIVNGAVAALMATGLDFAVALALVTDQLPFTFDEHCMPKAWK